MMVKTIIAQPQLPMMLCSWFGSRKRRGGEPVYFAVVFGQLQVVGDVCDDGCGLVEA